MPKITPKLETPPAKVAPPTRTAVCEEARISLALSSIRMPWRLALIEPVSTIAPLIVVASTKMALAALIAPVLAMLAVERGDGVKKDAGAEGNR